MSTIITRAGKGSPLTNDEVDANFNNLNSTKVESSAVGTLSSQNANGVAITGGTINGATVGATTVAAGSFTTLNSSGNTRLGGLSGNQSLQVNNVASAVNYAQIVGSTTGQGVNYSAQGTDTNIFVTYDTKGSGSHFFRTASGATQFQIASMASAVNYMGTFGGTAGNYPALSATGSDANVGFVFNSKGTAFQAFQTNSITQAIITYTASAVNYLNLTGAATGAAPTISAQGSDTNIGLKLSTKGTGRLSVPSAATVGNATDAASQFAVSLGTGYSPGSAWTTNSATFGGIQSSGSSAAGAVGIAFDTTNGGWISCVAPGQGYYNLRFDAQLHDFVTTGSRQFRVQNTSSAVNYIQATGAVTTAAPELSAQGSDANINLKLTPKGTGVLQFGTYTAGILAQTGYITITDAGGTSRRLLVG